jgi:hypothetical protein
MSARIMDRDFELLQLLASTGWLSSRQIQYALFPKCSIKVVNKRLRKLEEGKLVKTVRPHRTAENIYRLERGGRKLLLKETDFPEEQILMMRALPRELEHFTRINDLRLIFEQEVRKRGGQISFFLTDMELRKRNARSEVIPDAITRFNLDGREYRFAIEYDNGTETANYFAAKKVRKYILCLSLHGQILGLSDLRVLVFADSFRTAGRLMKASIREDLPAALFHFSVFDCFDPEKVFADVYLDPTEAFVLKRDKNKFEILENDPSRVAWHALLSLACRNGASTHQPEGSNLVEREKKLNPNIPNKKEEEPNGN